MRIARLLVLGAALLVTPALAQAAPIAAGDYVVLTDGPGANGGGEFNMFVNGSATSFITFCLQRTQNISFNQQFIVGSVSTYADDPGGNDPISSQTAWLYTQARNGTLAGYNHTSGQASTLQKAFWYFENEMTLTTSQVNANSFITLANQAVTNGFTGIGNVRVANLFTTSGQAAQDQLVLQVPRQVPGPAALTLVVPGLAALVFMRRRRTSPQA